MMKKTFALLLAAILMLATLTACGGDKPADTTGGDQQTHVHQNQYFEV